MKEKASLRVGRFAQVQKQAETCQIPSLAENPRWSRVWQYKLNNMDIIVENTELSNIQNYCNLIPHFKNVRMSNTKHTSYSLDKQFDLQEQLSTKYYRLMKLTTNIIYNKKGDEC